MRGGGHVALPDESMVHGGDDKAGTADLGVFFRFFLTRR